MRKAASIVWAAALAVGCSDYLGPSGTGTRYALARIGPTPLPVFLGANNGFPLLLADTLELADDRPRSGDLVLSHVAVMRLGDSRHTRVESDHRYELKGGRLSYDECPIGAACIAIVAAPRVFQLVGDSLFEIIPEIAGNQPRVYGRVRF